MKNIFGKYRAYTHRGNTDTKKEIIQFVKEAENNGAGEILLTSIDREGTFLGYDLELIQKVSDTVSIPVIVSGGARDVNDFAAAVKHGASAVAAGSMFVFQGKLRGVLINFPSQENLQKNLYPVLK